LAAYNPLIPDGHNWKVTLLIEFPDENERRRQLTMLKGIEDRAWVQVSGHERVFAIADEDLERENDEKTSAVHFLRFELTPPMIAALRGGAGLGAGIDHPQYRHSVPEVGAATRQALIADLS
jgi:precorrin-3B methylase